MMWPSADLTMTSVLQVSVVSLQRHTHQDSDRLSLHMSARLRAGLCYRGGC